MQATESRQDEDNKEENDEEDRKAVEFGSEQTTFPVNITSKDTLHILCRHELYYKIKDTTIRFVQRIN